MARAARLRETAPVSTNQTQPRKLKRGRETALDMVRSMSVLGLAVGLVLLVTWRPTTSAELAPVDLASVSQGAEAAVGFDVVVPKLNADWKATSARFEPVEQDISKFQWHIGYVTPLGQYVAIEQSDTNLPERFLKTWTADAASAEIVMIEGNVWTHHMGDAGQTIAYTSVLNDSVIAIVGTADQSEIMTAVQAVSTSQK